MFYEQVFDADAGANGDVIVFLRGNGSSLFAVEGASIVVRGLLDREAQSSYELFVIATNEGSPSRWMNVSLDVIVTDANDNSPVFAGDATAVYVYENHSTFEPVLTVLATDLDIGENGNVSYSISDDSGVTGGAVRIDPLSGEVYLQSILDYDDAQRNSTRMFQMNVTAWDQGTPSLASSRIVTFNLMDVNDETPYFTRTLYLFQDIAENASCSTVVGIVDATDRDVSRNFSDLRYGFRASGVEASAASALFAINPTSGVITVDGELDFENISTHYLIVTVRDSVYDYNMNDSVVRIDLSDVNDNRPNFPDAVYTCHVAEEVPHAQPCTTLVATDADAEVGNIVDYFVGPATAPLDAANVTLNRTSGMLMARAGIDREVASTLSIVVCARDNGAPPLMSAECATVRVIVSDINDHSPQFGSSVPEVVQISEGRAVGSVSDHFQSLS